ncbi:hypothetical protein LTR37_013589 [Vermiconidia calcicola]|uniref:Uncharacterized protein n=1 Tax=Vermiconidia calcicola TaxID=1690605 RepID=A0ACC3MW48_9PEZI|nr:hypothetical protein LTR37_013589 [Vermiconidia calcicola]
MSNNYGLADPASVDLTSPDVDVRAITCFLNQGQNEYDVVATRATRFHIPIYVYLFARYFGAGVIVATAFIHLLAPAYDVIGPATCVGMTGGWAEFVWPPAIALVSAMFTFLMGFAAERYVHKKYKLPHAIKEGSSQRDLERTVSVDAAMLRYETTRRGSTHQEQHSHQGLHSSDQDQQMQHHQTDERKEAYDNGDLDSIDAEKDRIADIAFRQQISAFLVLEFGVLFHSVIIGLALGTAGAEFATLYPVLVFHQSFEGLGIGARLSAIPFPKRLKWMPWTLCTAYGLTTPIAIAAALGVRTTYNAGSFTASVVSGVLDSLSAGILLYTGFVELIARDFLFNPDRTEDDKQLTFMIICLLLGVALMALLGKWA